MQQLTYPTSSSTAACVCCGATLYGDSDACRECQLPRHLSSRINKRGAPPQFVSLVGASGSGKTVYLGMLVDMLTKGTGQLKARIGDAFSVAVQEQTMAALQNHCFPQKTPSESDHWNWVHCEVANVENRKNYLDLITPDFAGEAIAFEMDNPGTYPAIPSVLSRSQAIIMLCDSLNVRDRGLNEDLFAMKLASYIQSLMADAQRLSKSRLVETPLAIILTKCDWCPEAFEDAAGFAANNMTRLLTYCRDTFANFRFFAASAVGSHATLVDRLGRRAQVPLHTEPRGITEPVEWILKKR